MYTTINGWTKERMKQTIRERNNGRQAFDPDTIGCMYLTQDGNRCAVGCFIPDGHPGQTALTGIHNLLPKHPDLRPLMPLDDDGLRHLQDAHDLIPVSRRDEDVRDVLCQWIDENVQDG